MSDENPPEIIGVNQLLVSSKNDPHMKDFNSLVQSDIIKQNLGVFFKVGDLVDVYEK